MKHIEISGDQTQKSEWVSSIGKSVVSPEKTEVLQKTEMS